MKQAHIDRIHSQYSVKSEPESSPAVTQPEEIQPVPEETSAPVQEQPVAAEPEPEPVKQEDTERKCPRCGALLVLRTVKKGDNAGKQFYGCSAFPKCRYMSGTDETEAEPVPEETSAPVQEQPVVAEPEPEPVKQEDTEQKCPRCGAALVLRTAKKGDNAGKQFYGCSAFPKCRYMTQSGETE